MARRRLELLSAELAATRPDRVEEHGPGAGPEPAPASAVGPPVEADRDGVADAVRPTVRAAPGRHARRSVGPVASTVGWLRDRLPAGVAGSVPLTAAHVAVIGVLLLGGLGATLWWVARVHGDTTVLPTAVATPAPLVTLPSGVTTPGAAGSGPVPGRPSGAAAPGAVTGTAAAAATASPVAEIVVDVTGKVRRPGIATLPVGSRVVDALEAAGGPRRGVSLRSLNLARVLVDGEQVVVGLRPPGGLGPAAAAGGAVGGPGGGSVGGTSTPMVDINTADQAQLELLPGVGPVTAQAIMGFRAERGAFTSVEELLEVSGIGEATLAKIAPYVTL